jgi:uncharacterized membrane protein
LITAAIRQYFVLRHFGKQKPVILVAAVAALIALAYAIAPQKLTLSAVEKSQKITDLQVQTIIEARCSVCHSSSPTDNVFKTAPAGVMFNSLADIKRWAPRIKVRSIDASDMPFMNKTQMTKQERRILALWLAQNR